jgi:hypothetical protein
MAFLTEYSYRQLINRIQIKDIERIDKDFFKTNIFDNDYLFYFFNQFELKKLLAEKILLSGEKRNILVYQEVPERVDDLSFVLSIRGNIKYHKDRNCEALYKGFKNFFIPEPIVRLEETNPIKHKELVTEIRNWFKLKDYTVERYEKGKINDNVLTKDFNETFPEKFNISKITISQSEKGQFNWYVEKKTKGIKKTEKSFEYDLFLNKIIELIKRRDYLCNSKTMQNISRYDFLINKNNQVVIDYIEESIQKGYLKDVSTEFIKNYGIENLKKFWTSHLNLKKEAMGLLSDFFKWTYSYGNNTFDVIFLEDYNLRPCRLCFETK